MCILLGAVQLILNLYICIDEYKRKSPMLFLWGTLFIMFGATHFIACVIGDNDYPDSVLIIASIFAIGFCLIYIFARQFLGNNNIQIVEERTEDYRAYQFFYIAFTICVLLIAGINIRYSGGIMNTSWSNSREVNTASSTITSILGGLFYPLSCCLVLALVRKDKKWSIIASGLIVFTLIITRNRVQILPLAICFFAYLYIYKEKKLTPKNILTVTIFAVVIVYVVYAIRALRWFGTYENLLQNFTSSVFHERMKMFLLENDGELGLRRYFYYFISKKNAFDDFGKGHTYIRMLLWWVPTSFTFGIKPDDFAWTMGRAVNASKYGFSMHPTLFGDAYANFGILGMFSSIIWAALAKWFDRLSTQRTLKSLHMYCVIACGLVIIGRGAVYNGFFFIMIGIITIALGTRIAPRPVKLVVVNRN